MQFDTGSSDLILSDCECDSSCDKRTLYEGTSASSTAQDLKQTFKTAYGEKTHIVDGKLYKDVVTVAGYTASASHPHFRATKLIFSLGQGPDTRLCKSFPEQPQQHQLPSGRHSRFGIPEHLVSQCSSFLPDPCR